MTVIYLPNFEGLSLIFSIMGSFFKVHWFAYLSFRCPYVYCCLHRFFLVFLGLYQWHTEVPKQGVQLELQLLPFATATATLDPSLSVTYTTVHGNARS